MPRGANGDLKMKWNPLKGFSRNSLPEIELTVMGCSALVDSGYTCTLIRPEVAQRLVGGRRIFSCKEELRSVSGTDTTVITRRVYAGVKRQYVAFLSFTIQIYPNILSPTQMLVRWRSGWFCRKVRVASKNLLHPETRYSKIDRERLGIVWAIEHFHPYLWGNVLSPN